MTKLTIYYVDYEHKSVIQLVRQNVEDLEEFGLVAFQMRPRLEGQHGGGDVTYAALSEPQATLLITMMRNTTLVKKFKVTLVKAFYELKEQLRSETLSAPLSTGDILVQYAQAYKVQEERLHRLETSQNQIAEEMTTRFAQLETDIEEARAVPPKTMRDEINEIVQGYVPYGSKTGYKSAWLLLYREYRLRYKVNLTTRAKNAEMSRLDWAESYGHLYNLWCLSKQLFSDESPQE